MGGGARCRLVLGVAAAVLASSCGADQAVPERHRGTPFARSRPPPSWPSCRRRDVAAAEPCPAGEDRAPRRSARPRRPGQPAAAAAPVLGPRRRLVPRARRACRHCHAERGREVQLHLALRPTLPPLAPSLPRSLPRSLPPSLPPSLSLAPSLPRSHTHSLAHVRTRSLTSSHAPLAPRRPTGRRTSLASSAGSRSGPSTDTSASPSRGTRRA